MAQTSTTMIFTNKPLLLVSLICSILYGEDVSGTFNQQEFQEKGAFGTWGQMIDITNDKSVQTAIQAYDTKKELESAKAAIDAYKAADAAQNANPAGLATSVVKDQLFKYKSSVVGTGNFINNTLKKVQGILDNAADRVNRWRTTLPKLRSYSETAGNFIENTAEYVASFEISDLWDLDQKFFRGLEDRARYGKGLGVSFAYFILNRQDGFAKLSNFLDAYYATKRTPYMLVYDKYGLTSPEIKDLNNEDRVGMMAIMEAKIGYDRLNEIGKEEYVCDPGDPELDCNCQEGSTSCKPSTRRELIMKKLVTGFNNPKLTTEDMDKMTEQLEARRLQIAAKRKVIQEVKARMASRYNDVLSYRKAMQGEAQNVACLSSKALLFDDLHLTSPKYLANTCDDVSIFKGRQMTLVAPLSKPAF